MVVVVVDVLPMPNIPGRCQLQVQLIQVQLILQMRCYEFIITMLHYCGIDIVPLHDDGMAAIYHIVIN
jgi:hypothetical protein